MRSELLREGKIFILKATNSLAGKSVGVVTERFKIRYVDYETMHLGH